MRKTRIVELILVLLAFGFLLALPQFNSQWAGVDETVVERIAEQANRPPHKPFINTDQGDLLLFFFLVAGAAGGFIGGYYFRELFPPANKG